MSKLGVTRENVGHGAVLALAMANGVTQRKLIHRATIMWRAPRIMTAKSAGGAVARAPFFELKMSNTGKKDEINDYSQCTKNESFQNVFLKIE